MARKRDREFLHTPVYEELVAGSLSEPDLYSLQPRDVGGALCETIESYFLRLAREHCVSPRTLHKLLIPPGSPMHQASPREGLLASLSGAQKSWYFFMLAERLRVCTKREDVMACTVQSLTRVVQFSSRRGRRHCPLCERDRAFGESWIPFLFEVGCVTSCPVHRVRLVASKCGAENGFSLPERQRSRMPGVCWTCGSLNFRCVNAPVEPSWLSEDWTAKQVAEAVALVTGGDAPKPKCIEKGLSLLWQRAEIDASPDFRNWYTGVVKRRVRRVGREGHATLHDVLYACMVLRLSLRNLLLGKLVFEPAPIMLPDDRLTRSGWVQIALPSTFRRKHQKMVALDAE
ncbi:hypothetical protein E2553_35050 [Paraburkholderia dipogonis]|uniref:TniQ domain-containing protein n=1 Tax=Paraburkholderia dipogonis TaxID=1211383 RepID=A0A4Y8MWD4_9BURK|nr:hypothetical protein E2553_35050 [Paraburkholderia dipogonis]